MARLNPRDSIPYAYCPGSSLLHRLPAGLKLLLFLSLSFSAFFFGFPGLCGGSLLLFFGTLSAGIKPWELFRGARYLLIMTLLVLAFRSWSFFPPAFNVSGFTAGCRFAATILVSFAAASLLFKVTTMTEFRESIRRAEGILRYPLLALLKPLRQDWACRLRYRLERPRLSLGIALLLGFLPQFFEIWETASKAYAARAGKKGISRIIVLIPVLSEGMMERAGKTARALEVRGVSL
ncbi:energy-coupling factor transporter transmembrane protein EcfT [Treponema sp. TIM-1]|uniref:CbiQ family ECF transporter T component n=1 Tax=Treponema sp. TIM-1 TaxID=2898417 RepID=UPI00397FA880